MMLRRELPVECRPAVVEEIPLHHHLCVRVGGVFNLCQQVSVPVVPLAIVVTKAFAEIVQHAGGQPAYSAVGSGEGWRTGCSTDDGYFARTNWT
jgi:hypothetical protein